MGVARKNIYGANFSIFGHLEFDRVPKLKKMAQNLGYGKMLLLLTQIAYYSKTIIINRMLNAESAG